MSTDSFYVSKGFLRVAKAPAVLRAVVGPGFVVCVRTSEMTFGGMVHLESESLEDDSAPDRIVARVYLLLENVESAGEILEGATADIVGGADILHIYPQHLRQEVISTQVGLLTTLLKSTDIGIKRIRVGGSEARRVEMTLPGDALEVRSVSKPRRKPIEASPSRVVVFPETPLPGRRAPEVVVNMGCLEVAESPTHLVALLGSCVGIALYDPETKIGALAHVMLPSSERGNDVLKNRPKFADTAVPALVEALANAGASSKRVVAKLAGGANVLRMAHDDSTNHVGTANTESSIRALSELGIDIVWQDTGGNCARKMSVSLEDFDVSIRMLEGASGS